MSTESEKPTAILSRGRIVGESLEAVKVKLDSQLGKVNDQEVGDFPAGSLKIKAVTASGGPEYDGGAKVWKVLYEWEPV